MTKSLKNLCDYGKIKYTKKPVHNKRNSEMFKNKANAI